MLCETRPGLDSNTVETVTGTAAQAVAYTSTVLITERFGRRDYGHKV